MLISCCVVFVFFFRRGETECRLGGLLKPSKKWMELENLCTTLLVSVLVQSSLKHQWMNSIFFACQPFTALSLDILMIFTWLICCCYYHSICAITDAVLCLLNWICNQLLLPMVLSSQGEWHLIQYTPQALNIGGERVGKCNFLSTPIAQLGLFHDGRKSCRLGTMVPASPPGDLILL